MAPKVNLWFNICVVESADRRIGIPGKAGIETGESLGFAVGAGDFERHVQGMPVADSLSKVSVPPDQAPPLEPVVRPDGAEPSPTTTEELMNRVQQGDMNAYQELIRLYQRKVFRVISGYHRNPEDAMEVVQDTFLKVYASRETWERRSSFSGWLYRIAINASIDRYRRNDKAQTSSWEEVTESQVHRSSTTRGPRDPLEKLQDRERRRMLEEAVRRLPDRQRQVVSLRYFGEMQLDEIAGVLECPLGTVKSNLHKAVMSLKNILLEQKEVLL